MVVMRGKCPGENTSYSTEFQKDTVFSRTLEVLLTKGQWVGEVLLVVNICSR